MHIFFSVGDPSGDLHGSNLIRALRDRQPGVACIGYGGPKMQSAGADLHEDLTQFAVMGFGHVWGVLPKFLALVSQADRFFRHQKPDAVVLIDYPGFNWWIARRAKVHGIPVFYYGAPQLWAWASWRVEKMRRLADHVLCKLPFEEAWYRNRGCNATYVGHPYFDQLKNQELDQSFLDSYSGQSGPLVTILPGSRKHEVKSNLGSFLKASRRIRDAVPAARFAVASYNAKQAELAKAISAREPTRIDVLSGKTQELIQLADCCMACSGSVSLELLYHCKPTVIHYRVNRFTYGMLRPLIKVKYITLVNILDDENPFTDNAIPYDPTAPDAENVLIPEYPTYKDKSLQVAEHAIEWLTDESKRRSVLKRMAQLKERVCSTGASEKCVDYILQQLSQRRSPTLRPHHLPSPTIQNLPQRKGRAA